MCRWVFPDVSNTFDAFIFMVKLALQERLAFSDTSRLSSHPLNYVSVGLGSSALPRD